jgi:hypothetical protein
MLVERQQEIELNNRKYMAASAIQSVYRGNVARKKVLAIKAAKATRQSFQGDQSEVVLVLKAQQKKAALQADRAAAIAVQTKHERKAEVDALRQELDDASSAAAKAKEMEEELSSFKAIVEILRHELEVSRGETERVKTRLAVVEAENKALKEKLESGTFHDGYKSTRFEEHSDLMQLDERIHNIAMRSRQGRKDLDALVQSLAILR